MSLKQDHFGHPYLFERFDCGAWIEIIEEDGEHVSVFVPGHFIAGVTYLGHPVLDPMRADDPPHNPDFYMAYGYRPPVELEQTDLQWSVA